MNFDFISDIADDESTESSGILTGWENVVFELEDEPDMDERRAGSQPAIGAA